MCRGGATQIATFFPNQLRHTDPAPRMNRLPGARCLLLSNSLAARHLLLAIPNPQCSKMLSGHI